MNITFWQLAWKTLWRDLRAGQLRLLIIAVTLAVAALTAEGTTRLENAGWASISFPEFWSFYPGPQERSEA